MSRGKFKGTERFGEVSYILNHPRGAKSFLVLAHGAGAGMEHTSMSDISGALESHGIATLRFNFPFKESGKGGPNTPGILKECIHSAIQFARKKSGSLPLFAGGKSMGGRMLSLAASEEPLKDIHGLLFFGFPLHAPGKPSSERGEHLKSVKCPMLFLQGSRDTFGRLELIKPLVKKLGRKAILKVLEGADHSFKVLKKSEKNYSQVLEELAKTAESFVHKK